MMLGRLLLDTRRIHPGRRWFVRNLVTKRQKRLAKQRGTLVVAEPKKLIKTNLKEHLEWIESERLAIDRPPTFAPDPSGIVKRDLTEEVIDMKEMYDPRIHLPSAPDWQAEGYETSTPLTEELISYLAVRGVPITVAEYMRQALTHPLYGYYTNPSRDDDDDWDDEVDPDVTPDRYIIGSRGDFVTAPEISQVFGECLTVWFVIQWRALGMPKDVQLVEVGPGRGTLVCDMLRCAWTSVPEFFSAIREIHLVEASTAMRQEQRRNLESLDLDGVAFACPDDADDAPTGTIRVKWHDSFVSVMTDSSELPSFVTCQEFLDALPVHAFEKTQEGWRERMVDVAIKSDQDDDDDAKEEKTRLRIVVAPEITPACQTLLNVDESGNMVDDDSPVGQVCEICPEGILFVQDIAHLLEKNNGAALLVDYGQEGARDSLRGFSKHRQVSFLSKPGEVDVTADVDFAALRHAINETQSDALAFGPVPQGAFLASMGVMERVTALIEDDRTTEEQAQDLYDALERLVLPDQMGERYKVLAITKKQQQQQDGSLDDAPPGFDNHH